MMVGKDAQFIYTSTRLEATSARVALTTLSSKTRGRQTRLPRP
jgi:hypothetical protein